MTALTWLHRDIWWTFPAAAVVWIVWRLWSRRRFVAFSAVRWFRALRHRPSLVRRLPHLVGALAVALVLVALMDPALPYSEAEVRSQGLDITLGYDQSLLRGHVGRVEIRATAARLGDLKRPGSPLLQVGDVRMVFEDVLLNPFAVHSTGRLSPLDARRAARSGGAV